MKALVFSEKSLDDLHSILEYISRDKPEAAIRFIESLEDQCVSLDAFPGIGARRDDLAEDLRLFSFCGYAIYYRELSDEVRVERVLRGAIDVKTLHFE
jgi:toxin ParE1/3/4